MAQSSEELTSYVNKNHLGQVCLGFLVICGPKKVGNFKASVFQWHLMDHLGDTSPPPKKKNRVGIYPNDFEIIFEGRYCPRRNSQGIYPRNPTKGGWVILEGFLVWGPYTLDLAPPETSQVSRIPTKTREIPKKPLTQQNHDCMHASWEVFFFSPNLKFHILMKIDKN